MKTNKFKFIVPMLTLLATAIPAPVHAATSFQKRAQSAGSHAVKYTSSRPMPRSPFQQRAQSAGSHAVKYSASRPMPRSPFQQQAQSHGSRTAKHASSKPAPALRIAPQPYHSTYLTNGNLMKPLTSEAINALRGRVVKGKDGSWYRYKGNFANGYTSHPGTPTYHFAEFEPVPAPGTKPSISLPKSSMHGTAAAKTTSSHPMLTGQDAGLSVLGVTLHANGRVTSPNQVRSVPAPVQAKNSTGPASGPQWNGIVYDCTWKKKGSKGPGTVKNSYTNVTEAQVYAEMARKGYEFVGSTSRRVQ